MRFHRQTKVSEQIKCGARGKGFESRFGDMPLSL